MRSPNKSRSRNKNNNRRPNNAGNVINRVFDSNGPQGRVRGTPNQIIEKYQSLAQDAMLAGDRVEAENFSQHAEHYIRMMATAQAELAKEQAARQAEQEARQAEQAARHAENEARNRARQAEQNSETESVSDQDSNAAQDEQTVDDKMADPRDEKPKKPRRKPTQRKAKGDDVEGFDEQNAPEFLKVISD